MKILLDENISYRVIKIVAHQYPEMRSMSELGLLGSKDTQIWEFAKLNHYTIFTNDEDFCEMSVLKGHPPKVIWLKTHNLSKQQIAEIFLEKSDIIREFIEIDDAGCLEMYG